MNREQREVFSLLKEVDMICRENGIQYYLSPALALCAVTEQPFPLSPLAGRVLMKAGDMEKFRQIFENSETDGRVLESMMTNKRFPGFYLRYTNTETLCYRMNEGRNFRFPGLGIDILPLKKSLPRGLKRRADRMLERGWKRNCDLNNNSMAPKELICKVAVAFTFIAGRSRAGRMIYRKFCRDYDSADAKKYVVNFKRRGKGSVFPAELFDEACEVTLEGVNFYAPRRITDYLTAAYGKNALSRKAGGYKESLSVITSAYMGCEEFLRANPDLDSFVRRRRREHISESAARACKKYFDKCWARASFCADKRRTAKYYKEREQYIRNLSESDDYIRLRAVFRPYTRMMRKCLEENDLFSVSPGIDSLYRQFLSAAGSRRLLDRIERLGG